MKRISFLFGKQMKNKSFPSVSIDSTFMDSIHCMQKKKKKVEKENCLPGTDMFFLVTVPLKICNTIHLCLHCIV